MKSSLFAVLIPLFASTPAFAKLVAFKSQDAVAAVRKSTAMMVEISRFEPESEADTFVFDDVQVTYRGRGLGKAFTVILTYDITEANRPAYQCSYTFSTRTEVYTAASSIKASRLTEPKLEYVDCTSSIAQSAK
jgi:hypothetical protein